MRLGPGWKTSGWCYKLCMRQAPDWEGSGKNTGCCEAGLNACEVGLNAGPGDDISHSN
jgi:hypothetical protein